MTANAIIERPPWLKKRLVMNNAPAGTSKILSEEAIHTVCSSAFCPNQNECLSHGQATFLLLGDVCTRACAFCAVKKGMPQAAGRGESFAVTETVKKLGLRYAVLTSVTRDDLEDGGASQFVNVIRAIRQYSKEVKVEVLTPDFKGNEKAVKTVIDASPDVFGHNIETVERLYFTVRAGADYHRSLNLLRYVKKLNPSGLTKSSIMAGLGESAEELLSAMKDLRQAGCDILTIGQYLRPRKDNLSVAKYVKPREFGRFKEAALGLGFKYCASGPFVRSSYLAEEAYNSIKGAL